MTYIYYYYMICERQNLKTFFAVKFEQKQKNL